MSYRQDLLTRPLSNLETSGAIEVKLPEYDLPLESDASKHCC